MARRTVIGVLVVAAAAVALIAGSGGQKEHELRGVFRAAVQVYPGQQVRIAGRKVGTIRRADLDGGLVVVTMDIDDDAWPLRRGTTAALRYGTPAGYATRFVELHPGRAGAPELPERGILGLADTATPVEFDEVFNTFTPRARRDLRATLSNAAGTLGGRAPDLRRIVRHGARALPRAAGLQHDLGTDRAALRRLVRGGGRTLAALRSRDNELRGVVTDAATTLRTLAANTRDQQTAFARIPTALGTSEGTLRRLDTSVGKLSLLVADLRPGARSLREVAPVLQRTLATLRTVAPQVTTTLRTGTRTVPHLSRFLGTATPYAPTLTRTLERLTPMLACLRPYTPEIAAFASTWLGFTANYDKVGHYARILLQASPLPAGSPLKSTAVTKLGGGFQYAMPRPPGLNAGQPWFQPQCGAGREALDPEHDPENGR